MLNNRKKRIKDRILPEQPKYASCPLDGSIKEYYAGQFDEVYIVLHPFLNPVRLKDSDFLDSDFPTKQEILHGMEPISWEEVRQALGFQSLADVEVALRTMIHGLNNTYKNEHLSRQLIDYLHAEDIWEPRDGMISYHVENYIYHALVELGYDWVWLGDDLGTERKLYWIEDLFDEDKVPANGCIFTPDYKVLVTAHWDSHCSFLCGSKEVIEKILQFSPLEGFYCTDKTHVFWGVYPQ